MEDGEDDGIKYEVARYEEKQVRTELSPGEYHQLLAKELGVPYHDSRSPFEYPRGSISRSDLEKFLDGLRPAVSRIVEEVQTTPWEEDRLLQSKATDKPD
jgi:hypothetical protein